MPSIHEQVLEQNVRREVRQTAVRKTPGGGKSTVPSDDGGREVLGSDEEEQKDRIVVNVDEFLNRTATAAVGAVVGSYVTKVVLDGS